MIIKKSFTVLLFLSLSLSIFLFSISSHPVSLPSSYHSDFSQASTTPAFAQSASNTNKSVKENNNFTNPSFRTYTNPSFGISLQYPSTWAAIELKTSISKIPSGSLALLLPALENSSDTYREKILVSLQDLGSKNMTLDEYTQRSINAYLNQSNNNKIHIIESSTAATTLSGNPAHKIVFTESFVGHHLKKMQIWSIVNSNKVYLLIFSAEESKYNSYLPDVMQIFRSFRIFKPMTTTTTTTKAEATNATRATATANLNQQQQQNLTYEDFGIKLQYPASWIKVQHGISPLAAAAFRNNHFTFFFVEFISRHGPTPPLSTVNLGIRNLLPSQNIQLAQYSASIMDFISKNGGKLVETGAADTKVGGNNPAQKVVYTLGNSAKIMYLWAIKGDKAYHFVYRSTIADYPVDLSAVNAMLNSIQFK
jgi:uncharacterized protein (DUF1330 family)